MNQCMSKQGFFSLRACGEQAVRNCASCDRPMCSRHLSPASGFARCLDCVARGVEQTVLTQPGGKSKPDPGTADPSSSDANVDDEAWAHRYRHRYYTSRSYSPFYYGSYDPYYDDYDMRSFDRDLGSTSGGMGLVDDRDDATAWGDS